MRGATGMAMPEQVQQRLARWESTIETIVRFGP